MALHRLAFIFLCLPLMASAAPFTSPGDRDLIRDRQQRLLDEQRKRLEELQQLPGKGAPAAADASGGD
ncbi:ShlB/FhaC/HecB family hemolysin secretion/activation protein, partial [Pseudomonas aeruginosa]